MNKGTQLHQILDKATEAYIQNQQAIEVNDNAGQIASYSVLIAQADHFASLTGLTRSEAVQFIIDESRRGQ